MIKRGSMNDIVPRYNELFLQVLIALKELGGSATNNEIYEKITELGAITDDVLDVLHHDGPMTQLEYRLRWTQSYLKSANLLANTGRGIWSLTQDGRSKLDLGEQDLRQFVMDAYRESRKEKRPTTKSSSTDLMTEDILETELVDELEWNLELLTKLKTMDPSAFERLSQRILR